MPVSWWESGAGPGVASVPWAFPGEAMGGRSGIVPGDPCDGGSARWLGGWPLMMVRLVFPKQVSCRQPAVLKVGRRVNKARLAVAARASLRAVIITDANTGNARVVVLARRWKQTVSY
jgi:hypothetical protein